MLKYQEFPNPNLSTRSKVTSITMANTLATYPHLTQLHINTLAYKLWHVIIVDFDIMLSTVKVQSFA